MSVDEVRSPVQELEVKAPSLQDAKAQGNFLGIYFLKLLILEYGNFSILE